jgi:hypothetical protein
VERFGKTNYLICGITSICLVLLQTPYNVMKKGLLCFITFLLFINSIAQQRPVPDCGPPIPALILMDPVNQQVCPGGEVTFVAAAGSSGGLWWSMSTDNGLTWEYTIPNSTATPFRWNGGPDSLTLFNVTPEMNGYLVRGEYASPCGPRTNTQPAILSVGSVNISIETQPVNTSACKFSSADFLVTATGSSAAYQWQQSIDGGITFVDLTGNTTSKLTLDSVTLDMSTYQYRCIVSSNCSSPDTSLPAVLTVRNESTTILTQPVNQNLCSSDTAVLSVVATGNNLSYQWQDYYTVDIGDATDATLRLPYQEGYHSYRCKITSTCKTIYSNTATLNYTVTPSLLPAVVRTVCNGQQAFISAISNYQEANPGFQWQVSTDSGVSFNNITGENLNSLALTSSASINGNRYRCLITQSCFTGYSNVHEVYNKYTAAQITLQPEDKSACAGSNVIFRINSTDDVSVSDYQWQVSTDNGVSFINQNMTFAVGKVLTLPGVTTSMNNYQYRCMVYGCGDTAYSDPAVLTVSAAPSLGYDTAVNVTCDTCTADLAGMYNTSGFTGTYWSTSAPASATAGKYYLKVSNAGGCSDSAFIYVNVIDADTIRACDGAALRIVCSIPGTTFQWEWDHWGPGYFSSMSEQFSGTNGPVLFLPGILLSGRLIRCRVDGILFTNIIYVKPTAYWNGAVDSNWSNPLNWSCGQVPGPGVEVIITEGIQRIPLVNVDASCKKLFARKNAEIIIQPGVHIKIGP